MDSGSVSVRVLRRRFSIVLEIIAGTHTKSNRSTSTSPLSVILRCGITGSVRKATCRKGSASTTPSAFAAAPNLILTLHIAGNAVKLNGRGSEGAF